MIHIIMIIIIKVDSIYLVENSHTSSFAGCGRMSHTNVHHSIPVSPSSLISIIPKIKLFN